MLDPIVSIAMPVLNCAATLPMAVRSLQCQTFADWELLLIDDGSTDGTRDIIDKLRDDRIRARSDGKHRGITARLNEAIGIARGELFGRMDGDDVSYPERLKQQVELLSMDPGLDLVGAWSLVFKENGHAFGKRVGPAEHEEIVKKPHAGFSLLHPTWLGRLGLFRLYRYDLSCMLCEDQDLLLRSYRYLRFANVCRILYGYREENMTVKGQLRRRFLFLTRALLREFVIECRPGTACRAVVGQTIKALIDAVAIYSGLNYSLLKHRAQPLSQEELREWEMVWKAANEGKSGD
jgi:glycosyltransferase involved in cell wall biosynthesis